MRARLLGTVLLLVGLGLSLGASGQTINPLTSTGSSGGGGSPTGPAGGDLSGSYPNPTVANLSNVSNASLANAGLVNVATTVNGQTCTLGSTCTVTAGPTGAAGGDLSGTYPNPTVAKVNGVAYGTTPASGTVPYISASNTATYSATPTLGASGTLGSLTMGNGTSGTLTLQPAAGAITGTVLVPSGSDTLVNLAGTQALTNKTYNGNAFTAGTGTLTIAAGKTLTSSNSLTLAGTDSTTMTFPTTSATIARTDAGQTFTGVQTMSSPAITTPAFTGTFTGTYALGGTPTINVAAAVGGTWTAAATWTLPAVTLGGTVTGTTATYNLTAQGTTLTVGGGGAASTSSIVLNGGTNAGVGTGIKFRKNGSNDNLIGSDSYVTASGSGNGLSLYSVGAITYYANNSTTSVGNWSTAGALTVSGGSGPAVGIGMAPTNVLDITQSQNATSAIKLLNSNASGTAQGQMQLSNGTSTLLVNLFGTGFTTAGINIANRGSIEANGAGGLVLHANNASGTVNLAVNGTIGTSFDTTGPIFTTIGADTATADATLCRVTATGRVATGTGTIGICLGTSSLRYKQAETVKDIDSTDWIMLAHPTVYRYKPGYIDDGVKDQFGFIAEELAPVMPKLVGLDEQGQPNTVDLLGMVPFLVKKVQEQQAQIDALQARVGK